MNETIWFIFVSNIYKAFCNAFPSDIRQHCWWYMGENILWDSYEQRRRTKYEIVDWAIHLFAYTILFSHKGYDPIYVLSLQTNSNDNGFLIS